MNRILAIRGGAIGDFILTLPALKALRDANPRAHIEILGYEHIAALAKNRFYAQAVRSIEYGPLARFFAKGSDLSSELSDYFASFDLVISYLYDPDAIFETNLRRCGVENFVRGPGKIDKHAHAADQLARPLREIGITVDDFAAKIYPSVEDRHVAQTFLDGCRRPIVAFHPGSGSQTKNWPLTNWIGLGNTLLGGQLIVVAGEADEGAVTRLQREWQDRHVRFAKNLPLPHLAAVLEKTIFVGHDSGISHLAAATGANCVLLFGPTDPTVWAPMNENVSVVHGAQDKIDNVQSKDVEDRVGALLMKQPKTSVA